MRRLCSTACLALLVLLSSAACSRFDRANRMRDGEIERLSHETFAQASEHGRCLEGCGRQEAGFAYAKKTALLRPDDCLGRGDEDFVEGCRQYGEDIEEAYRQGAEE